MLKIENLFVKAGEKTLLDNINFELKTQKNLTIMGASGSGKSTLAKSFIKLLAPNLDFKAKTLQIFDFDILKIKDLQALRANIAYIFQDPKSSFPPFLDMGSFFLLCAKYHLKLSQKELKKRAFALFEFLNLKDKERIWHSYIYHLSTGEAMRVQIALVLLCGAKILICDEPSANLDFANAQILLSFLKELQNNAIKIILITHDLSYVKALAEQIIVLENACLKEQGSLNEFLAPSKSAYAKNLSQFQGLK